MYFVECLVSAKITLCELCSNISNFHAFTCNFLWIYLVFTDFTMILIQFSWLLQFEANKPGLNPVYEVHSCIFISFGFGFKFIFTTSFVASNDIRPLFATIFQSKNEIANKFYRVQEPLKIESTSWYNLNLRWLLLRCANSMIEIQILCSWICINRKIKSKFIYEMKSRILYIYSKMKWENVRI